MLKAAAQLSLGYLADEVRELLRGAGAFSVLFDTQDTNFVREIDQNTRIDNIVDGPPAVDARRDKLALSFETL